MISTMAWLIAALMGSAALMADEPPKSPAPPATPTPATPPAAPPAAVPESKPAATPPAKPADPSVEQIIKDMEKSSPKREDIRAAPGTNQPTTATPPAIAPPATPPSPGPAPAGATPGTPAVQPPAAAPGANGAPGAQAPGRLLREGSFLVSRRGRMVKTRSNEWAFAFDSDGTGKADIPMILQPCLRLAEMERTALASASGAETVTFTVSGQVFVYKGRNYLLPTLAVTTRPDSNLSR